MYILDASHYGFKLPFTIEKVECIGWVDSDHQFNQNKVSAEFVNRLRNALQLRSARFNAHVNKVRGIHACNICGEDVSITGADGQRTMLGMSELWIPYQDKYFAAPSLIYHYIVDHGYCPPDSFVDAILQVSLEQHFIGQEVYDLLISEMMSRRSQNASS